jgi:DNA-binding transcriptional LysR family regulator
VQWQLQNGNGETMTLTLPPRLAAHHFTVLRDAALSYLGLTYLPETYCRDDREPDPQAIESEIGDAIGN